MLWFVIMQILSTTIECIWLGRKIDREKDLEILLLRRQLDIVDRARDKPLRISRAKKLTLAVLAFQLKAIIGWSVKQFGSIPRIFQPETVFRRHRELVRRKWTYRSPVPRGRPRTNQEIERLILRLARENRDWGNNKIAGELTKLGIALSDETVGAMLRRLGITPASVRGSSLIWRQLMTHYRDQILACDFFHGRNFVSADALCILLHRAGQSSFLLR